MSREFTLLLEVEEEDSELGIIKELRNNSYKLVISDSYEHCDITASLDALDSIAKKINLFVSLEKVKNPNV